MFDKTGVFYSNDPFTIFNSQWLLDNSKILDLKKHNLVVLDFASEHYGIHGIDHVYRAVDEAGLNFLLLSHEPSDHQKFDRMFFYPHWYHWAVQGFVISKTADPFNKTYKWSCLNLRPRPHRIYNYIYSRQQPHFKDSVFSFYKSENVEQGLEKDLDEFTLTAWKKIRDSLPHITTVGKSNFPTETLPANPKLYVQDDSRCDLPANADSYIHLVTETSVCPRIFVSEKTWKPIMGLRPFIIHGQISIYKWLQNNGFKTFSKYWSHIDIENDSDQHGNVVKVIDFLSSRRTEELFTMYQDMYEDLVYNRNRFFEFAKEQKYKMENLFV